MGKKHKKGCTTLNHIKRFLILVSAVTGCNFMYAFTSLLGISIGITNSTMGLRICAITAGIES